MGEARDSEEKEIDASRASFFGGANRAICVCNMQRDTAARKLAAPGEEPLSDAAVAAALRELVNVHGLTATARMLGMTREPIARGMAGIRMLDGTRALLRERLRARVPDALRNL